MLLSPRHTHSPTHTNLLLELRAERQVSTGLVLRLLCGGGLWFLEQLGRQGIGRLGQELDQVSVQSVRVFLDEFFRSIGHLSLMRACVCVCVLGKWWGESVCV